MKRRPRNKRLYQKANEIFTLSRNISDFLVYDLSALRDNGQEDPTIYFTGDIIRQSNFLASSIRKAENQTFQDERIKHANFVASLTNRLYKNCERLEKTESNGKDFVKLLRKELKKFQKLQHNWMMTL